MTFSYQSAAEAAAKAKVEAANAAQLAQKRAAEAKKQAQQAAYEQQSIFEKGINACLRAASATGGDVPEVGFSEAAFTRALGLVQLRIAHVQRQQAVLVNLASNGSSQRAADIAASAAENLVSAESELAALQAQITSVVAAVLEKAAPGLPEGADVTDCQPYKEDFRGLLSGGNANQQAAMLAGQLRKERNALGLATLLGAPMRYTLQGLGVNRQALLRNYVQALFTEKQQELEARPLGATPDFLAVNLRGWYDTPWQATLTPALYDLVVADLASTILPAARALLAG